MDFRFRLRIFSPRRPAFTRPAEVVLGYCERYPQLQELRARCKAGIGDIAEMNVGGAVRDGDLETSRWLLRSNMFTNGRDNRGYGISVSSAG